MRLDKTYEQSGIHDSWEAVYRGNSLPDALNDKCSIQAAMFLFARRFYNGRMKLKQTDSGIELWAEEGGQPYVVRIAHERRIKEEVERNSVAPTQTLAAEF